MSDHIITEWKNNRACGRLLLLSSVIYIVVILNILLAPQLSSGAPFAEFVKFTQPDKTEITLWGVGDDFHAVFETTSGYTVFFDPQQKAYFYAERSSDGKSLLSNGVMAHFPVPEGLAKHIRIDHDADVAAARLKQKKWDEVTGLSKRWSILKSRTLGTPLPSNVTEMEAAPPSTTTVGTRVGLTLLIDFSDAPATISQSEIDSFLNSDSYTGYNNNGSVKKYFSDVSNGRLTYTNVTTIYVRMTQPKSYYNDISVAENCGTQGRLLINDALTILKARPDYNSTILPTFNSLTTDASGNVLAFNVYFAGANSGVWARGLWPHSWALVSPVALGNGKYVSHYQITNVGTSLELGTFCHENGHMLCDFPDLYDYDYDSFGGAGKYSLMGYGGHGTNPSQVDAYLKTAAGWTTVTDITSSSSLTGMLVAAPNSGFDSIYRYRKPGSATEYYLLENRQKTGRDAGLPSAGIAVWHVDELGDRDNQSLKPNSSHENYELTLVQADNLWHFETYSNSGDAYDLYYLGNSAAAYANILNDSSAPNAHWWDGTESDLILKSFSATGMSMTFSIGSENPIVISTTPAAGALGIAQNATVRATFSKAMNAATITTSTFYLNNGVTGTVNYDSGTNTATFTPSANLALNTTYTVTITTGVTDGAGHPMLANKTWSFTTTDGSVNIINGGFENGLNGWSTAQVSGTAGAWTAVSSGSYPTTSPHGGSTMARFNSYDTYSGEQTRLYQTTGVSIPSSANSATLSFWMNHDTGYSSESDQVQAQISTNGSTWTNVGSPVYRYDGSTGWKQVNIDLLAYKGQSIQIAFLGTSDYGNNIYLDDAVLAVTYPLQYILAFTVTGNGSVNSVPSGIACTTGNAGVCSVSFDNGTPVTLTASGVNATTYLSHFGSWGGDYDSASSNTSDVTMDGNKSISATFITNQPVQIPGGGQYASLQAAYDAPGTTAITIWSQAVELLVPNFLLDKGKTVTLKGGYDSSYGSNGGNTLMNGALTVGTGSLTVDRLAIK